MTNMKSYEGLILDEVKEVNKNLNKAIRLLEEIGRYSKETGNQIYQLKLQLNEFNKENGENEPKVD